MREIKEKFGSNKQKKRKKELKNDVKNEGKYKKSGELLGIYRTFFIYAAVVCSIQAGVQTAINRLGDENTFWHSIIYNLVNVGVILLLMAALGYRYYRNLRRISQAIARLEGGAEVSIPEEGVTAGLASSINKTSDILKKQREIIERRDNARAEWIRGVSHDIRTPLSIIMGYSELIEDDESIGERGRKCAGLIKEQSIRIRDLIEDLNLTMKLEYNKQPLRLSEFSPSALLRETVANAINSKNLGLCGEEASDIYNVELVILPEFEKLKLNADMILIKRVLDNIFGNAIRHNPAGCRVLCLAYKEKDMAIIEITDDGRGIPEGVASEINSMQSELLRAAEDTSVKEASGEAAAEAEGEERPSGQHIMGLRIAKQIMLSHGGNLIIKPDRNTVQLIFAL